MTTTAYTRENELLLLCARPQMRQERQEPERLPWGIPPT
jgi:hypothetical protein